MHKYLKVLEHLRDNPGLQIHEIARDLGFDTAVPLSFIPTMKYRGYIEQKGGVYYVTSEGMERIQFYIKEIVEL